MNQVKRLEYAYGICPNCKQGNYLRYLIHNDGMMHPPYEIKCINCNSYFTIADIHGDGNATTPKPQTNADRIRAMSDEELARWIADKVDHGYGCCAPGCNDCRDNVDCVKPWLDWLQQEAKT